MFQTNCLFGQIVCFICFFYFGLSVKRPCSVHIKAGVEGVEIFVIQVILNYTECIAKALEMYQFAFSEETDRVYYVGVLSKTENVVVGLSCFLLWCNHIRTNFLEIPMNFYGNIPCSGDSLADRYVINQRFYDFAVKVFQVCVLFNEFAAVITNRNFVVDFG